MAKNYPYFLAGTWAESAEKLQVTNPYNGQVVGVTYRARETDLEQAIQSAVKAFEETRHLSSLKRTSILDAIVKGIEQNKEEFARTISLECGKAIKDSRGEVDRAMLTFRTAAEEAKRFYGEVIPLDLLPGGKAQFGIIRHFPLGPILAISPFNFPLNLVAHKLAPAFAAGNTVVLKPASKTPLTALLLAKVISETELPPGALSVLCLSSKLYDRLVADDRFKLLSFTGSHDVGWALKAKAGKKRTVMELGGNAGVIVDKGTNIAYAAKRVATGSFALAGQSCISVQRAFVHQEIYDEFSRALKKETEALKLGDPLDPTTDVGPMIDGGALEQTSQWVKEAVAEGAHLLTGGKARGPFFEPTVITDAKSTSKVCRKEAFAPVVTLAPFKSFKDAVAEVNDSDFGLQAGVFTDSLDNALYAFQEIQTGGVVINDVPTWRLDPMPYGGTKDSGQGREGIRYAMEEMSELKLLAIHQRP